MPASAGHIHAHTEKLDSLHLGFGPLRTYVLSGEKACRALTSSDRLVTGLQWLFTPEALDERQVA